MNKHEEQYLNLLQDILDNGEESDNRTDTRTLSVFGRQLRFDLSDGSVPLMTTKKINWKFPIIEMLWFLSGDTNIKYLTDRKVNIWNKWSTQSGDLGPVYGRQWRDFNCVDQIQNLITGLINNPKSRRHIVTAWNPVVLPNESKSPQENVLEGNAALASCHCFFQCYVSSKKRLSLQLYIRSSDTFIGAPYNIIQYAVLLRMLCKVCHYTPGELIITTGDSHIYVNHIEQVKLQLTRNSFKAPKLVISRKINDIDDFQIEDFNIIGYEHHPFIKAPVAV